MSTYYYAAAALPMLSLSEEPTITSGNFLDFCSEQLTEADYRVLEAGRLDISGSELESSASAVQNNRILKGWHTYEISLRNELVKQRALELKKDAADYSVEGEEIIGMEETAKNAAAGENPLETEKKLYEARWNYLEELGTNIFFTLESLLVYYLQLQLLEKLNKFNPEAGEAYFNAVYTTIRESADQDENSEIESNSGVNP